MSLDFYENNYLNNNIEDESNLEYKLEPKAKAARREVIDTAIKDKVEGASSRNTHIEKADDYAENFNVFGINDWLKDGKTVFGIEEIKTWANNLPYPLDDIYYLN